MWGASCAPTRARGRGARPQARRSSGGPSAGRVVPRAGPTNARTPTDAPDRGAPDQPPGRAGGAARRAAPNASFDLTRRGRVVAPRVVQNRDRVLWDSDARPGGRGRRRRTSSGDCRQSSRGEAGPTARAERGGVSGPHGPSCSGMREYGQAVTEGPQTRPEGMCAGL